MSTDRATLPIWRRWWVLFLVGPVAWYLHFWLVYMVAEAVCAGGGLGFRLWGLSGLSIVVLGATLVAVLVTVVFIWGAWRSWTRAVGDDNRRQLMFAGFTLGILFLVGILFVGLPALVLSPC